MTHNQIDYMNLVENRRHNLVTENLSGQDVAIRSGTLTELERHNIASEDIGYANIRQADIASQRAAAASKYSSDVSSAASRYGAETSAAAQRYNALLNAETQKYNVGLQTETQKYVSDSARSASMYSADKQSENVSRQVEATKRGQNVQAGLAGMDMLHDAAKTWYSSQISGLKGMFTGGLSILGGD